VGRLLHGVGSGAVGSGHGYGWKRSRGSAARERGVVEELKVRAAVVEGGDK
jgi:hypothetical protein